MRRLALASKVLATLEEVSVKGILYLNTEQANDLQRIIDAIVDAEQRDSTKGKVIDIITRKKWCAANYGYD